MSHDNYTNETLLSTFYTRVANSFLFQSFLPVYFTLTDSFLLSAAARFRLYQLELTLSGV